MLLAAAPREVVAVDVGYGQLAWRLRTDDAGAGARPHQRARAHPRATIGGPVDLTVADLSFISLALGAARARRLHRTATCCRWSSRSSRSAGSGWAPAAWSAIRRCGSPRCGDVAAAARELGCGCAGVVASPLPGPSGNVEFFLWLRRDGERRRRATTALADGRRRRVRDDARGAARPAHRPRRPTCDTAAEVAVQLAAARDPAARVEEDGPRSSPPTSRRRCAADRRGPAGLRRGRRDRARARRRRHLPAGRRAGPPRRRAAAGRQPRPGRVPRRGRGGASRAPSTRSRAGSTRSRSG